MIRWSGQTQDANLELVINQARDAVRTFLDTSYAELRSGRVHGLRDMKLKHPVLPN